MSILSNYQVEFFTKTYFDSKMKLMSSINEWMSAYMMDYYTIREANRLLNNVNNSLNNGTSGGGQTQSMYFAFITNTQTKIYKDIEAWEQNNSITPDFVLPTSDFKVIVEAWLNFLSQ